MPRRLLNFLTALSLLLCVAALACWLVGSVGERNVSALPVRARGARTWFVRLDRQHLILSEQHLVADVLPPGFAVDSTRFRLWTVTGAGLPGGQLQNTQMPGDGVLNPTGAWFGGFRTQSTGFTWVEAGAKPYLAVRGFYGAIEIPWWLLVLAFSLLPAYQGFVRYRAHVRHRRSRCRACGYDLRATPGRCPECGTIATPAG